MKGKDKCELLKSIRRDIAKKNGITLEIPECTHKGDCPGSCPRCESEVKYLEKQLEARRRLGIKPIVAGISAGLITVTAASCDFFGATTLEGDMSATTDGVLPITETTDDDTTETAIEGTLAVTEHELTGSIAISPETDELVLDGDIAYPPDYED